MNDGAYIRLGLNWGDEHVGAFELTKVVRQLLQAFPCTQVDPTDHQEVRLQKELAAWLHNVQEASAREGLIRSSWGCYRRNGPSYRFVIPFGEEYRISGWARRLSVSFFTPRNLSADYREQLLAFLRSLKMGEPILEASSLEDPDDASQKD